MNDHKSLTSQNGKHTEGVTDQSPGQRVQAGEMVYTCSE